MHLPLLGLLQLTFFSLPYLLVLGGGFWVRFCLVPFPFSPGKALPFPVWRRPHLKIPLPLHTCTVWNPILLLPSWVFGLFLGRSVALGIRGFLGLFCAGEGEMAQGGADFHLPDEILAVIPTDPYDQLDLARKITSMAIASRVSRLEGEAGRLRQKVVEKDRVIAELQDRLGELDRMFQEADARLRTSLEENIKLSKERDSLALTAKKLSRELSKLEAFKRNLMQSLNEDDSSQMETVDIGTCDQFMPKASTWKDGGSVSHTASNYVTASTDIGNTYKEGSRNVGQKFSTTSHISPRLTPTATPKVTSTGGSPRGFSAAGSPKMLSGATSPTKPRIEGKIALSPWYPSSQLSSAANSPPRGRSLPGRTPRVDGKEFFRQARSRLSYEQFGAFLANIKELNAHRQSREETLKKAEEIFGTDNKDLYLSFQGLLNRNIP